MRQFGLEVRRRLSGSNGEGLLAGRSGILPLRCLLIASTASLSCSSAISGMIAIGGDEVEEEQAAVEVATEDVIRGASLDTASNATQIWMVFF